jgi:hypothetical protein
MKDLPEIRIKDAYLLRENVSKHLHELWGKENEDLADNEWMQKRVKEYQKAWKPFEKQILAGLTEIIGASYRQNIIDVYIAPWFNAFSDPLVVGVTREPDEFIDILTHELIHRILTDNSSIKPKTNLISKWEKLFGRQKSLTTLVHIPVHSVHKAIYLDVLKEKSRLLRDINSCRKHGHKDYVQAWDYVEKHDYKKINELLKASYRD